MTANATTVSLPLDTKERGQELFEAQRLAICRETDYLFAGLLVFQYAAGIFASIWISPRTWAGSESEIHIHVWAATVLSGVIISLPLFLIWRQPGSVLTRHAVAAAQMLFSALLIHLCGGRIETHFHVFGSLAFLAFYRDWRVLVTATVIVAVDHFVRGIYWPQSVFGVVTSSPYRAFEHAGWVVFEDVFLIRACLSGVRELRALTSRQAQLEATNEIVEEKVRSRTEELEASQAELLQSENRMRAIVETAVDGIITIDSSGSVQTMNPAAERLFGYESKEVVGRNVKMLMPSPYSDEHDEYLHNYLTTGVRKIIGVGREVSGLRSDGETFPIDLAVSQVDAGDEQLFTGVVRDIRERVAAQRQLRDQAQELVDRNAELLQLKEEADQANVAKSQFLANMSHELRTPMNAIIGYSEILEEELTDLDQEELIEDVKKIHAAGQHLLELINDVLDLSKIEAGKVEIYAEEFDLAKFLNEVKSTVQPLIDQKSNRLIVKHDQLGSVYSDQTKLRQCLLNLLSNAAKFTKDGLVTIEASRLAKQGDDWIKISVQDTGIGMTAEQLSRVFDAFTQAEGSTTRRFGGTGLGLTITKKFCEMLGGDILVESETGAGTLFQILIPASIRPVLERELPADGEEQASLPQTGSQQGRPEVLVVDDDPVVLDLLKRFLSKEGYAAFTVSDSRQAVEVARARQPLAITLDVMMPEMDGWSVLRSLKDDAETADIPVIMVSMVDDSELAFTMGVEDYLTKPIDRSRLGAILDRFQRGSKCQVLVVDDDANNRDMLVRLVEKADCMAVEAENGRQALSRIDNQPPDLVLLDLMMPEMDGFEFARELNKLGHKIPIIVLTAKDLTAEERQQLTADVSSIREKGKFSRDDLLSEIKRYLKQCSEN